MLLSNMRISLLAPEKPAMRRACCAYEVINAATHAGVRGGRLAKGLGSELIFHSQRSLDFGLQLSWIVQKSEVKQKFHYAI